jgi:hypothetical protein
MDVRETGVSGAGQSERAAGGFHAFTGSDTQSVTFGIVS